MDVLYISVLASEAKINSEYKRTGRNPGFAVQKFSRLLVKGLLANGAKVLALSNHGNIGSKLNADETEAGIHYKYIPYFNIPVIKHLCLLFYTFFYVLFWGVRKKKNGVVVCDILSVSTCIGAIVASWFNNVPKVAVVTDIFSLMAEKNSRNQSLMVRIASRLNAMYSSSFDKYILLTEQMNEVVNPKDRPHIVMEALCDSSVLPVTIGQKAKDFPRTVLYAGGIHEIYGLKMLAEGFIKANIEDAVLVYYGSGPYVEEYKKLCKQHPKLVYRGVASNEEVLEAELRASLLVNPRFSTEEFTKFSFPSKNMEYMASGTPLLTTNLPGMPQEYHPYVFFFKEETVEGYAEAIRHALSFSEQELQQFGQKARQFVITNKNNIVQGQRILNFIGGKIS